jgi:hypothetical protein
MTAAAFVVGGVTRGESLEMRDQAFSGRYSVRADLPGDAWTEDLLRSARSNAEESLEGLAIDPRPGQAFEFGDDLV